MLLCSLLFALLMADEPEIKFGESISESDWAVQENPEKGIYDAVLLEDVTTFRANATHFYRRVRILNESGKAAAEYFAPKGNVKNLKGRVVDRSGKEITFSKKEDFVKVLVFKTRGAKQKTRVLVPPGLTKDAVVEFSWRVNAEEGMEIGSYEKIYLIQSPYYVMEKRFHVRPNAFSSYGYLITQLISTPIEKPAEYITEKKGKRHKIVYKNVPPLNSYPFGNRFLDRNTAYLMLYKSLPNYPQEKEKFWDKFCSEWLKDFYSGKLSGSKEYSAWIKSLKSELPAKNHEALVYAYEAFRARIKTPDLLTPTRLAQIKEDKDAANNVLRRAVSKGFVSYSDAGKVFLRIVKDLDIECFMLFSNSFNGMLFFPNHMRPFSLPLYYPVFGTKMGNGNWVMVSPLYQEYPPGYVPTQFQGATALVVDPFNKWSHNFTRIPRFGPKEHQRITQYNTVLAENGDISFNLKRRVSGEYNAWAKKRYFASPEDERETLLRNRWESRLSDMNISEVSLEGVETLKGNVIENVAANGNLDADHSDWLVVSPFPGQLRPLSSPSFWPEKRSQPVILPRCVNQVDLNVITVPEGWSVMGKPSWRKSNAVGEVRYTVEQKGSDITVRRDIQIKKDILRNNQEGDLKSFIAWMTEAMNQRIGISKGAGYE